MAIRHLGADKGTGAEMSPAVVNGIVTADVPVSYWPIFSPCLWSQTQKSPPSFLLRFLKWRTD